MSPCQQSPNNTCRFLPGGWGRGSFNVPDTLETRFLDPVSSLCIKNPTASSVVATRDAAELRSSKADSDDPYLCGTVL